MSNITVASLLASEDDENNSSTYVVKHENSNVEYTHERENSSIQEGNNAVFSEAGNTLNDAIFAKLRPNLSSS